MANEAHSSDWVKLKEILEAEPFVVLLSAIRNASEHNDGYISPVNYSSQDQTFGLAINLDRVGNVGVSAPTADRQTQAAPVLESGIAT